MRRNFVAGLGLVAVTAVSGCSGNVSAQQDVATDIPVELTTVVFDERSGAIRFPSEEYWVTERESLALTDAVTVANALCARDQGVTYLASRVPDDAIYDSDDFVGPWTMAQAEQFGFVPPMTDADLRANEIVDAGEEREQSTDLVAETNGELTKKDRAVIEECSSSGGTAQFSLQEIDGPWVNELAGVLETRWQDPVVEQELTELNECYGRQGLKPQPESAEFQGLPAGADRSRIDEEQIAMAITMVECKQETGFTETVAHRFAELEAPVLARYHAELVAVREEIDATVARAKDYIAAHPEAYELPAS